MPELEVVAPVIEHTVMVGDLSDLTLEQRAEYYTAVCRSLGLSPLTKPFEFLTLNGKLRLYALRDCTDQLRRLHGISIYITNRERLGGHCQLNGCTCQTGLLSGTPSAFRSDYTTRSGMSALQTCPLDPRSGRGFSARQ